jgi:hypothetical protein
MTHAAPAAEPCPLDLMARLNAARARRSHWEGLWDDAYDFALPQRAGFRGAQTLGRRQTDDIYDATAMDGAEQLAASLLGHLTPGWTPWFGLKPGPELAPADAAKIAPALDRAGRVMRAHFAASNFAMEVHQCYLDLVVGGTASLAFEENDPGHASAFRFTATPLTSVYLEEGPTGFLDGTFRVLSLTEAQIRARYPRATLPAHITGRAGNGAQARHEVVEAVLPRGLVYDFTACLIGGRGAPEVLVAGTLEHNPIINFRWTKTPGEIYGRSPVMKALPDIKTANRVVELILKNASIAVTGLWQAEDDGIMNPANIELRPGAIIPKAPGSEGLKPLEMPSNFDVSQIVLESLRARIRHALLIDRFAPLTSNTMTATEVLERGAEMALLLGATYGRLQTELLTPLITRAFTILRRRGEVPALKLDGRTVAIDYRSPLAQAQSQASVQNTLYWLESLKALGPEAQAVVDGPACARFLGDVMGVPAHLMRGAPAPSTPAEKKGL